MTGLERKWTDIHKASYSGDRPTVRRLIDKHPEWLNVQSQKGNTPLHASAHNGHIDVCRLLIDSGANKDIQNENGTTPLCISARIGHTDVCGLLIDSGANQDIQNNDGATPLLESATFGHIDICSLLIESGANKDAQNKDGASPLYASAINGHIDVCRLLIESAANKDIQKKNGATPLYISAQNGRTDICRLLIESGANIDNHQENGWTALMTASHFNRYDSVKLLVEKDANKDEQNMHGDTALHAAAHFGNASVVKLLVDAGASVLQSKNGNTPLHSCFLNQNLSYEQHRNVTVAFLMTNRSIVLIKNKDGKTVIDFYEQFECKKYDTERRSIKREKLLQILKGGPLPAIDFKPSGRTIPTQITAHGPTSKKIYRDALEEGAVEMTLGRVKVIGQERVGKSCLINACLGKKFNPDEEITDAIAIIKIVTKTAEEPNKWADNLTDSGSATEIYEDCMADVVIKKTVEDYAIERKDETPPEKEQTKSGTRATNVVRAIPVKGAGSPQEEQLRTKVPIEKIHVLETETITKGIWKKFGEGFGQGIYYKKQGMGEWHRVGEETFNIWDYGGHVIYHGMHRIFMTSEAVYIVVFKLNVDLDAKAIVRDSSGRYRTHHLTNLEFILYWIMSVYTHSRLLTDDMIREIALPAIVLVATHRDSLGANEEERTLKVKEVFKKISDALVGKPYEKHVYPKYFDIENNRSDIDKNIAILKKVLENLMTTLVRTVPLKWMRFRCELEKLRVEKLVCPLKEVKELATKCGIDDEKQCVLLNFLYDLGEIIYMPDNDALKDDVVLDPMGFVDITKTVITVIPPELPTAMFRASFRKLDKGILEQDLLKHLWRNHSIALTKFDFFVKLMMRFCLLCERKTSKSQAGTRSFFVPLRLALEPPTGPPIVERRPVDSYGIRAISICHDFCGYLPDELFPQLVTEFINKFQKETGDEPELAHDHVELYFDQYHHVISSLITFETNRNERKRMLMTTILRRKEITESKKEREPSSKACKQVLEFLEASFDRSQQGGRRGIKFKRCIPCICSKNSSKKHMQMLGNFEDEMLPCKRDGMDVARYKRLFGDSSAAGPKVPTYAEDFQAMLVNVSENIGEDLTMWKVALRDHIKNADVIQRATRAIQLFEELINSTDLKAGDIRILLETIKLTGTLRLQDYIPNCPRLDDIEITHFTKFRQSVMAFGMEITDDDIETIAFSYQLHRRYNDKWSLIMDLENKVILADDDRFDDFKSSLDQLGLRRLSRWLER